MVGHVFTRRPYQEVPILLLQAPAVRQSRAVLKKMHMVSRRFVGHGRRQKTTCSHLLILVSSVEKYSIAVQLLSVQRSTSGDCNCHPVRDATCCHWFSCRKITSSKSCQTQTVFGQCQQSKRLKCRTRTRCRTCKDLI